MGQTEIIQDTKTLLHIINTTELKHTVNVIQESILKLRIGTDITIRQQLNQVKRQDKKEDLSILLEQLKNGCSEQWMKMTDKK